MRILREEIAATTQVPVHPFPGGSGSNVTRFKPPLFMRIPNNRVNEVAFAFRGESAKLEMLWASLRNKMKNTAEMHSQFSRGVKARLESHPPHNQCGLAVHLQPRQLVLRCRKVKARAAGAPQRRAILTLWEGFKNACLTFQRVWACACMRSARNECYQNQKW